MTAMASRQSRHLPSDTNSWLERIITDLVLQAPENELKDFCGLPIFDPPLIGIADGDDSVFPVFRKAVSPHHLLPREILQRYKPAETELAPIRVVSWVLPFHRQVRLSNRGREWPSELYSLARNNGGALIHEVSRRLCQIIEKYGFKAASPALEDDYDAFRSARFTFSSSWSERHVAYAAGLGRFGLNGCLITPRGTSVRLASIVTDLPLRLTPAKRECYRAPCLENGGEACGVCIERCPVQAISPDGLDKAKCNARRKAIRENFLAPYEQKFHLLPSPIVARGRREMGYSLGCALCLSAVPCEEALFPLRENGSRPHA